MLQYKSKIYWLLSGIVVGTFGMIVVQLLLYFYVIPSWLVVQNVPATADAIVVLGGGGGPARLRKAITLYDNVSVKQLILVEGINDKWSWDFKRLGTINEMKRIKYIIVTGSNSTETDAQLSLKECREQPLKSIIAVTDPYHSRRTSITFNRVYADSGITVKTINSGDYEGMLPPTADWLSHKLTRDLIWIETGKTVGALLPAFLRRMFMPIDS